MGIALTVLALWGWYGVTRPEHLNSRLGNIFQWPVDFSVYYNPAQGVAQGGDLYSAPFFRGLSFTYPPFAVVFSPFSWYRHWVYLVPLFFVFFDATLRALERITARLPQRAAWWWFQVGGFAAGSGGLFHR